MAQSVANRDVEQADEQLAKQIVLLLGVWMAVFFLASVVLVLWGDVLMELLV